MNIRFECGKTDNVAKAHAYWIETAEKGDYSNAEIKSAQMMEKCDCKRA